MRNAVKPDPTIGPFLVTRRTVLSATAFFLALAPKISLSAPGLVLGKLDLFVFRSPSKHKNMVIGISFPSTTPLSSQQNLSGFKVRFHAGKRSWTIDGAEKGFSKIQSSDGRSFVGEIVGDYRNTTHRHNVVVFETPHNLPPGDGVGVWAEVLSDDGTRSRVGNPFIAELLADNPSLSSAYHQTSPDQDPFLFSSILIKRIAAMAAAQGGVADPEAYALRLIALLLPDVIKFNPSLPVGLSFANRNGRHPADATAAVTMTLLTGAVVMRAPPPAFHVSADFPYFAALTKGHQLVVTRNLVTAPEAPQITRSI